MRPRRARLGCRGKPLSHRHEYQRASMRPRRARLGCARAIGAVGQRKMRFNEAEARAPRMPRSAGCSRRSAPRASMRPRRARLGCAPPAIPEPRALPPASMRPRRARLGCGVYCIGADPLGACFNEAEARAPRMHVAAYRDDIARFVAASMRPRRARLGCSHPTSPWIPRQSCCVFDRWPTTMGETCQILHAIVLTMSKSFAIPTIYRDSSGCGVSRGTSPLESVRRIRNTLNQGRPPYPETRNLTI